MGAILRTLKSEELNRLARAELERRGLSLVPGDWLGRLGRRLGLERLSVGDVRKSWDVLETATFLDARVGRDQPIVDFGAYHSEITGVLSRMGYGNLHAIDLNPGVARGPYPDRIRYRVGDFLASGYASGMFAAITSISAIEHGHSTERLLAEVARLLVPGGFFVASTDYWPEKVDTAGIRIFGMDWTVFSAADLAALFDAARGNGLVPVGSLDYGAAEPAVRFAGKQYTFAWFALRKESAGA